MQKKVNFKINAKKSIFIIEKLKNNEVPRSVVCVCVRVYVCVCCLSLCVLSVAYNSIYTCDVYFHNITYSKLLEACTIA